MPRSRRERLVVQTVGDETLVYDLDGNRAHCLNKAAATIWEFCDGETTVREAASKLNEETGLPEDEAIVLVAITQLRKARLVEKETDATGVLASQSNRRDALVRLGLVGGAAMLVPLITSIVAPTAVSAFTCRGSGRPCASPAQCCSGLCSAGTCA